MKVSVRGYEARDEAEVLRLLQEVFEGWRVPHALERFRWKHEHNPFGPSVNWVLEDDTRQVIGFAAGMRWQVVLDGRTYTARRVTDLVVAPHAQRQGVHQEFVRQMRVHYAEDPGCDIRLSHRNDRSEGARRKIGLSQGRHLAGHLAPVRPWRLLAWWLWKDRSPARARSLQPVGQLFADQAALGDLVRRCEPPGRLITNRTVPYLRWRYEQFPGRHYVGAGLAEADGRLRGLLIGRCVDARIGRTPSYFEVSELLVPEDDRAAMRRLLRSTWRVDAAYAAVISPVPFRGRWEAAAAGFPVERERGWWFGASSRRPHLPLPDDIELPRRWVMQLGELEAM